MKTNPMAEARQRLREEQAKAFYGRRYFYDTANDGRRIIGVLMGLGETFIAGYFRESGSRKALKSKRLFSTRHADNLQMRLDDWAQKKGLTEVPRDYR